MLLINDLETRYGKVKALDGINIHVKANKVLAVLGANGAGKTTLLNTISGLLKPSKGSIKFLGQEITKKAPHQIVRMGIVHIEEGQGIFIRMTVQENLEMGAFLESNKAAIRKKMDEVYDRFPALKSRSRKLGATVTSSSKWMGRR